MTIRLSKKKYFPYALTIIVIVLLAVLGFKLRVFSSSPDPEVRIFDSNMSAKSAFLPSESGFFTIKAYRENITGTSALVSTQIKIYIKIPSSVEISYVSEDGLGTVDKSQITTQDGVMMVPVKVAGGDTAQFASLRFSIKFNNAGVFDALSNYSNCDIGQVQKLSETSRIEYINGVTNALVKEVSLGPLCVKVLRNGPVITKDAFLDASPSVGLNDVNKILALDRAANFEAGDAVVVALRIQDPDPTRSDFKIVDKVPEEVTQDISYVLHSNGTIVSSGTVKPSSGGVITFYGGLSAPSTPTAAGAPAIGILSAGENYLVYRYKI